MTQHQQIIQAILDSPAYRRGNEITLTTVRDALGEHATGITRDTINKAIAELADTGFLTRTGRGQHVPCSRAGHWLKKSWGRTISNRELFGDLHDLVMGVAA